MRASNWASFLDYIYYAIEIMRDLAEARLKNLMFLLASFKTVAFAILRIGCSL